MPVDERRIQRETLRQAHHRVVNRRISMRMVLTHAVVHDVALSHEGMPVRAHLNVVGDVAAGSLNGLYDEERGAGERIKPFGEGRPDAAEPAAPPAPFGPPQWERPLSE